MHHFSSNRGTVSINSELQPLSSAEHVSLAECEDVIRRGLGTFFEVGLALLTIREARLYRSSFPSFEAYCHERLGIGRSYAWRLIGAAERVRLLSPEQKLQRPLNEFQIRPFLKLEPGIFPTVWEQALNRAKDGRITSEIARSLVAEISAQNKAKASASRKSKRPKLPKGCSLGEIMVLLGEAKRGIEKGEIEKAIAAIDRIDSLLFGL
jgi:hypothetical protein